MPLDLRDCSFIGPALPEPFVKFQIERLLRKESLLPKDSGPDGQALQSRWDSFRRKLRLLGDQGGVHRVANHVLEPLAERLGYPRCERQDDVQTREGVESGGWLFVNDEGAKLRAWACEVGQDLDAPSRRGRAFRFSPSQIALRVLQAQGERVGLLTDGIELRLLLSDASRKESHIAIRLNRSDGWRARREVPDSYRLLCALASPAGVAKIAALIDEARLAQTTVTAKLRVQARSAVLDFVNELLARPENRALIQALPQEQHTPEALARALWHEGLIFIYRLLFVLQLEAAPDPARAFTFSSVSLWRTTYSPSQALAPIARKVLDAGAETGHYLEDGLRALFRLFETGLSSSEMKVSRLGGMLFASGATPLLDRLRWGERAVACLLDHLLWTDGDRRGEGGGRERVHYGSLDVENLGRVYEALLELEPGLANEPMCRLRRDKLEVVVPAAQGEPYRKRAPVDAKVIEESSGESAEDAEEDASSDGDESEERSSKKAKVVWVEDIPEGRFYLRVGLGRKASGSYYTPHPFVRFLVEETLDPQLAVRSPKEDPKPAEILKLRVLDPAMGSGHFLVEVCRFLGDRLYEACRLCDELAQRAEDAAGKETDPAERERHQVRAIELRRRVVDLPDPDDELVAYLPSRVVEGEASGLSQAKGRAIARRLIAVHCLYGVDKNPLAVELAKLSLWLESYAEGLPLTFLDHRLIAGDSLTGPFFSHLLTNPRRGTPLQDLFTQGLGQRLETTLSEALVHVQDLEASVGTDVADTERKRAAKERLDAALAPLKTLAAAWTGLVQRGQSKTDGSDDDAYARLADAVAQKADPGSILEAHPALAETVSEGRDAVPYDLMFPEVFFPSGKLEPRGGFDAVVGNPPWDTIRRVDDQFFASFDFSALVGVTKNEKKLCHQTLLRDPLIKQKYEAYVDSFAKQDELYNRLFRVHQTRVNGQLAGRGSYDAYMLFAERCRHVLKSYGFVGLVLPSGFHANEGATGVRQLYLYEMQLLCCFSFENVKRLFEIHASYKFAAIIAQNRAPDRAVECRFYLHDLEWLIEQPGKLNYLPDFIKKTGGPYLCFLELRSLEDSLTAAQLYKDTRIFGEIASEGRISLGQEVNMTYESARFTSSLDVLPRGLDSRLPAIQLELLAKGYLQLHEGKTFHQYQDRWEGPPRYLIHVDKLIDKISWLEAARYFRLAFRDIANSTNERTAIFSMLPPGYVCSNQAPCERAPQQRRSVAIISILAVGNSFSFDYILRTKIRVHVNLFFLNGCPFPELTSRVERFLVHSALRLSCNHAGYAPLWREQLGDTWREHSPPGTWPVLDGEDARWAVRAAIDAAVADAYGLSLDQYQHVLSSFSHKSYLKAPELCIAAYRELKATGLEAFARKHDPYWDIELVRSLPEPVLTFPQLTEAAPDSADKPAPKARKKAPPSPASGAEETPLLSLKPPTPAAPSSVVGDDLFSGLLTLLKERGVLASSDVQSALGLAPDAARPLLRRLVDEGHATVEGQKRGTRYRRTEPAG